MEQQQMDDLVTRHLKAEGAGDVDGCVAVYTDDIEHDVVGWPTGATRGKETARRFYEHLTANVRAEEETPTHRYYTANAMTLDQQTTAVVNDAFCGLPGNGRRVTFRSCTSSSSVTA